MGYRVITKALQTILDEMHGIQNYRIVDNFSWKHEAEKKAKQLAQENKGTVYIVQDDYNGELGLTI